MATLPAAGDRVKLPTALLLVATLAVGTLAAGTGLAPRLGLLLLATGAFALAPSLVVAVLSTAGRAVGDALAGGPLRLPDAVETGAALLFLAGVLFLPFEAGTVPAAGPSSLVPPVSGALSGAGLAATVAVVLTRGALRRAPG